MEQSCALITGASSGIGLEMAKLFAAEKMDLILVARSKEKLNEIATQLSNLYAIETYVIAIDLSEAGSAEKVFEKVKSFKKHVDYLVNNAGFGALGAFEEISLEEQTRMVQLNVTTLLELTHLFLPDMLKTNSGRILNVASTAAFQAGPTMATYFATKAFVLSFSEALYEELRKSSVRVTALCPGPTHTGFGERAQISDTGLFQSKTIPVMSAAEVARIGFEAMKNGDPLVIAGPLNKVSAFSAQVFPRGLVRKMTSKIMAKVHPKI